MSQTAYRTETVRNIAHKIFFDAKARATLQLESWEEMAAECAAQGFRPEYCIHGTSLWVDYDNICQGCEDGGPFWDDARQWADAKWEAEHLYRQFEQRMELAMGVIKADPRNTELHITMMHWSGAPIAQYT